MSAIPPASHASFVQAAQAQQSASKSKGQERARETAERDRRDVLELRAQGVESADAIRKLPSNESEEAEHEHDAEPERGGGTRSNADEDGRERVDVVG